MDSSCSSSSAYSPRWTGSVLSGRFPSAITTPPAMRTDGSSSSRTPTARVFSPKDWLSTVCCRCLSVMAKASSWPAMPRPCSGCQRFSTGHCRPDGPDRAYPRPDAAPRSVPPRHQPSRLDARGSRRAWNRTLCERCPVSAREPSQPQLGCACLARQRNWKHETVGTHCAH